MKRRTLQWNVVPDEGGQALTEFVIVIPIILLFFFAMLQYFAIVQATQLGNYAAFVAARVYAVAGAVDTKAKTEAQTSASIVLAPIARPAPNEIGGDTSLGNTVNDFISSLSSITSGSAMYSELLNFGTGYVMANYVRFNSSLLGGSITITNEGTPAQVDVTINYPQPIYVPGLQGLWNFLGGKNIYASLSSEAKGLGGIPGKLLPLYAGTSSVQSFTSQLSQYDSGAANSLDSLVSSLPTVLLPYINIQSKCSMGYSSWSGVPRLANSVVDSGQTNNSTIAGEAAQVQQDQEDEKNYTNDVNAANTACKSLCTADSTLSSAQQNYTAVMNNPKSTSQQKSDAESQLSKAESAQSQAEKANSTAQSNLTTAQTAVNNDNSQYGNSIPPVPNAPCSCQ